jgi:hypothetical protein
MASFLNENLASPVEINKPFLNPKGMNLPIMSVRRECFA